MADNNNVADKFRGLPIAELIAAPLKAVCNSQRQLAASTYDYIMQIGFNHEKEKNPSPRLVEFDLERPLKTGGTVKIGVQAPFLGLVPIPAMMVNEVNIDFQMEVTDTETTKSNTASDATVSVDASYGFLFAKANVKMSGKVSSSRENTRTTNQTAKYQVHVVARQQQPTEGMSKLMDILSSCVEEITGDAEEVKA